VEVEAEPENVHVTVVERDLAHREAVAEGAAGGRLAVDIELLDSR
jgi:hypothetical protein